MRERRRLLCALCAALTGCGGGGSLLAASDAAHDDAATHADALTVAHRDSGSQNGDAGTHDGDSSKPDSAKAGDASSDAPMEVTHDATSDAPVDAPPRNHGDASAVYPAFAPDLPRVVDNGGAVLAAPQIVTVTWPNETNVDEFEAFGDLLGQGAYWAATTSEYGIGPAVSGPSNHVRLTELPLATMSDVDVSNFIIANVTNYQTSGWPAPTVNSYYVLYLSAQTDLTFGTSNACSSAGGYHDTVVVNGVDTVYAVIPHCEADGTTETLAASHEIVEGSGDPHPGDLPAYLGFDTDHLAWDIWGSFQDELADACEFYTSSQFQESFSEDGGAQTFVVQRTWSNANAALGHDPCQPAVPGPYYNVAPMDLETISLSLTGELENGVVQTRGYHIGLGETKTFPIALYSDGPTDGPWTLSASEDGALGPLGGPYLTISLDSTSGQNGDIAYVTVTVNSINASLSGELVTIASQLGSGPTNYLPILISSN